MIEVAYWEQSDREPTLLFYIGDSLRDARQSLEEMGFTISEEPVNNSPIERLISIEENGETLSLFIGNDTVVGIEFMGQTFSDDNETGAFIQVSKGENGINNSIHEPNITNFVIGINEEYYNLDNNGEEFVDCCSTHEKFDSIFTDEEIERLETMGLPNNSRLHMQHYEIDNNNYMLAVIETMRSTGQLWMLDYNYISALDPCYRNLCKRFLKFD